MSFAEEIQKHRSSNRKSKRSARLLSYLDLNLILALAWRPKWTFIMLIMVMIIIIIMIIMIWPPEGLSTSILLVWTHFSPLPRNPAGVTRPDHQYDGSDGDVDGEFGWNWSWESADADDEEAGPGADLHVFGIFAEISILQISGPILPIQLFW